jgi:hypothetical protein
MNGGFPRSLSERLHFCFVDPAKNAMLGLYAKSRRIK